MADDWRVTVSLSEDGDPGRLLAALHALDVERDARKELGGRVAVSGDSNHLFLYADTESGARQAEEIVGRLLKAHEITGTFKLDRWHHEEEEWEDANVPLPSTAAEKQAEHERLEQQEAAESAATGLAEWEVRIELDSHRDAVAMAEQLEHEGFDHVVRRWKYLLVGTADEDDARALAARLTAEAPAGATIHVEPGGGLAWQLYPANPFAVFGGLAA
jgi:hypothetical protein